MHKAIKLFTTIGLLCIVYMASTYGYANLAFKQAEKTLHYWQKIEKIDSLEQYQQALDNASLALNWHQNPQYLEAKAQILEWGVRANLEQSLNQTKQQVLTEAKNLYIQSTQLRPAWPGTWAALALVKWHLGEYDEQMMQYLKNAHIFGKNIAEVHHIWTSLGIALISSNNPEHNELIKPYINLVNYHAKPNQ